MKISSSRHLIHLVDALYSAVCKRNTRRFSLPQVEITVSDRRVLFKFFSLCHRRNPYILKHWALYLALSNFGRGVSPSRSSVTARLGYKLSPAAFHTFLRNNKEEVVESQNQLLSDAQITVFVMDNNHLVLKWKHQHEGHSACTVKASSRLAIRVANLTPRTHRLLATSQMPPLKYIDPNFPSPPDFPWFENVTVWSCAIHHPHFLPRDPVPDKSGDRLKSYVNSVFLASQVSNVLRLFSSTRNANQLWSGAPDHFRSEGYINCRKRLITHINQNCKNGFFTAAKRYQCKVGPIWNSNYGQLTEMLVLKVASFDDMTTEGVFALATQYALQCGILTETNDKPYPYDSRFVICPGKWHIKYNMLETILSIWYGHKLVK